MPFIHVSSNVPKASVDANAAVRALSQSLSVTLDRPEQYVMVQLDLEVPMLFQGTDAPCAFVQIRSIGKISPEKNPATVKALTETVVSQLHLPAERVFLNLDDIAPYNWGAGGQVF